MGYIALWAAVVRYDIHMFQHNSYRVERYARWWRGGNKHLRSVAIAIFALLCLVTFQMDWLPKAMVMFIIAWKEFRTVYKKPIVYTMRVKRLFATAAILTAAAVGAALAFIPVYAHAVALALLLLDLVIMPRRNPKLRKFNIFRQQ